jgi:hypothetical protein
MSASWGAQLVGGPVATATGMTNVAGTATGPLVNCPGGRMAFVVAPTSGFNGATVTLSILGPDGAAIIPTTATLTAAGIAIVDLPPCQVQAVVTVAVPTGIFASIARVVA